MYWISLALIWIVAAAESDEDKDGVYMGYHRTIGIPTAAKIKEIEQKIMEEAGDSINPRIIGGYPTTHERFPWLAGLLIYEHDSLLAPTNSMCGGTLLDTKRVLTAAHCIKEVNYILEYVEVVLGSEYLYHGGLRFISNYTVPHPDWKGRFYSSGIDVGIIFIKGLYAFEWDPLILPTTMKDETFVGYSAHAAGYGYFYKKPGYGFPVTNQEVELEIQPTSNCTKKPEQVSWWLCTAGRYGDGVVGGCAGDSGGPLVVTICGKSMLVGIIIRNVGDCEKGTPTYHTRVTSILMFLADHTEMRY